ncbi:hypothetical protein BDV97DRAFT_342475 [Delphinella strobiligena]|nr:hypothetical protein BDV97DRAFT_342475 [Delphinella strobiligena]
MLPLTRVLLLLCSLRLLVLAVLLKLLLLLKSNTIVRLECIGFGRATSAIVVMIEQPTILVPCHISITNQKSILSLLPSSSSSLSLFFCYRCQFQFESGRSAIRGSRTCGEGRSAKDREKRESTPITVFD